MRKPDKELSRDPWYALHNGSTREIEDVKDIRVGDFAYLHTADGQALAFKVGEVIPHPDGRLVLARRPGAGVVWLGGRSRWLLSGILRIEDEDDEPALR